MKNFGVKSNMALDYLNGILSSVYTKSFEITGIEKNCIERVYREYNEDGERILSIHYDNDENIRLKQVSKLDGFGNQVGYVNYDSFDNQISAGKYEYDYRTRMIAKYHNGECEEQYKYDENDNIIQVYYPNTGARDLYEYAINNFASTQLSIRGEDSLFGSIFGGPNKKLTTFLNDALGNIYEMRVFDAETKNLLFLQKNKINDQGDEIESIGYNADGSVHAHLKYNYEYDNKNNWTLKQTLTSVGRVYHETTRTIKYLFSEDHNINTTIETAYRKRKLNGQQLALLFIALSKGLFPKPINSSELNNCELIYEQHGDSNLTLYFKNNYYKKLIAAISNAYNEGKFAASNAEDDWNDLMYSIERAEGINNVEFNKLEIYKV